MSVDTEQQPDAAHSRVVIQGVPWDVNSSFCHGAAQAPDQIRAAFHSPAGNYFSEGGLDLEAHPMLEDRSNLSLPGGKDALDLIERKVAGILSKGHRPLLLGGDHALSYPALRAMGAFHPGLTVIHFDAHPDLYDELDGNRFSHACPFARSMESGHVARLIQVGIRSVTRHQREQAHRFGVAMFEMRQRPWRLPSVFDGPLYLSLDLDVLDPAFAPGVSHFEPGGLSTRELLDILQSLKGWVVGADIVEFNPRQDPSGRSAMVAAKFVKEIAALMIATDGRESTGVDVHG